MNEITLLEPSMADVLKAIDVADGSAGRASEPIGPARFARSALTLIARSRPFRRDGMQSITRFTDLHAARVGANPKTLANHKANARAALVWFAGEKNLPKSGAPLMSVWAELVAKIGDRNLRKRMSGLIRYCSAQKSIRKMSMRRCSTDTCVTAARRQGWPPTQPRAG